MADIKAAFISSSLNAISTTAPVFRFCGQALGYCTKTDCTTREIGAVR